MELAFPCLGAMGISWIENQTKYFYDLMLWSRFVPDVVRFQPSNSDAYLIPAAENFTFLRMQRVFASVCRMGVCVDPFWTYHYQIILLIPIMRLSLITVPWERSGLIFLSCYNSGTREIIVLWREKVPSPWPFRKTHKDEDTRWRHSRIARATSSLPWPLSAPRGVDVTTLLANHLSDR